MATQWEYWPFSVVYLPVYLYWFYLSLRARSFFFFSTSNPGIENAGFVMESKMKIYEAIPPDYRPVTVKIPIGDKESNISHLLGQHSLTFPLVAKPDIGEKGAGVKKVNTPEELFDYHRQSTVDYIIQPWIPYPREIGLFYTRYPGAQSGILTGIVRKEFLTVTGNGRQKIRELMENNDRAFLQIPSVEKQNPALLERILPQGEVFVLVPYGNHSRGSLFLDDSHLINASLTQVFDAIAQSIPGFYYGRLDIRYEDWDSLCQGKNFSIIELNGAGSEPTHIYDPRHSVFFAWREIIRHLRILYQISTLNKEKEGLSYLSFSEGLQLLRSKRRYDEQLKRNV